MQEDHHHSDDNKADIDMIVNDDKMMESIIKEEVNKDIKMITEPPKLKVSETCISVPIKEEGKMSIQKSKIKHIAPITPSVSHKMKAESLSAQKPSLIKNNTAPVEIKKDKIVKAEHLNLKTLKNSKSKGESINEKKRKSKNRSSSKKLNNKSITIEFNKKTGE